MTHLQQLHTPRGIGILCDWFVAEAKNALIRSTDGREFIDFASGIATLNTGHRHPKVLAAVTEQLQKFIHTAYQVTPYASYIELAAKINDKAPVSGARKTCFFSTGAEAVENAIKIARAYTQRQGVIAFSHAFHGRTMFALALTGKTTPYKADFGMMPGGVFRALYPNDLHRISIEESIESIYRIFKNDIRPDNIAALILEPVQGEGGFYVAPKKWIEEIRHICDTYGIVLIADEIQSGFARTGRYFAMEHFGVSPDIMTIAKSLAGGFPLSGVVGKAELMDAPQKGGLGGTYAGNPVAISAALAVLDIIDSENLCERAAVLGARLRRTLENISSPNIAEIRGLGSMIAVEFSDKQGRPLPEFTKKIQSNAMEKGLLLLSCGAEGNVLRFLYPLTIEDALFEKALNILREVISAA